MQSRFRNTAVVKMCHAVPVAGAIAATGWLMSATSFGQSYVFTNIGALLGSSQASTPFALNNSDEVVGEVESPANTSFSFEPFVYTPSTGVTTLSQATAGDYTSAYGINNSGLVVGETSNDFHTVFSGFTYNISSSAYTTFAGPGGTNLEFKGVNNSGVAAGYGNVTTSATQDYRGIAYNTSTSTPTDVGTAFSGAADYAAYGFAINDSGTFIGYGTPSAGGSYNHPYVATPSGSGGYTYTDLQSALSTAVPGFTGATSLAMGIDSAGDVVGSENYANLFHSPAVAYLYTASGAVITPFGTAAGSNAFGVATVGGLPEVVGTSSGDAEIYYNGVTTNISALVPGFTLDTAYAVNSNGDIVASGTATGSSVEQAFLLTVPVPEPTSLAMLALGGVALLQRKRRTPIM